MKERGLLEASVWMFGFSKRTYRIAAIVVLGVGVPSVAVQWRDDGASVGVPLLAGHLTLVVLLTFVFPRLGAMLRRRPEQQSRGAPRG